MKIGIISDTHGHLPVAVYKAFEDVDHIIHAGDIGGRHILDELEMIAPVVAVLGNGDYPEDYFSVKKTASFTLGKKRFLVAHKPHQIMEALRGGEGLPPGLPLPHICVHGHTHIPRNEYAGAVLILCPGSPVRPRGGSAATVMLLDLAHNQISLVSLSSL
jgi:putative phosphoesterase